MLTFWPMVAGNAAHAKAAVSHRLQCKAGEQGPVVAKLRPDTNPELAQAIGLDLSQPLSREAQERLMQGRRADGAALPGAKRKYAAQDLCLSADKSVSVQWAFAPTQEEQDLILALFHQASDETMRYAAHEMGQVVRGNSSGGKGKRVKGEVTWITYSHVTAKPTLAFVVTDPDTGEKTTELIHLAGAIGDPHLHSHNWLLNLVRAQDGHVGSLDLDQLRYRVHEYGAYFQMRLGTLLQEHGVEIVRDEKTGAARIRAIPQRVRSAFSRRDKDIEKTAKDMAWAKGLDWNAMDETARYRFLHDAKLTSRIASLDGTADKVVWRQQAEALRWEARSVIGQRRALDPAEERAERAYRAAQDMLGKLFAHKSVVTAAEIRTIAARALIGIGGTGRDDIDRVTHLFRERGIVQDKRVTKLRWGLEEGRKIVRVTTILHVDQERELLSLVERARDDRGGALARDDIGRAIRSSGIDFADDHGKEQVAAVHANLEGGKIGLVVGPGGSGKTTLLTPAVIAWNRAGMDVTGISHAHRQADELKFAGIKTVNAVEPFLRRLESGRLALTERSVVVVDEAFRLGTHQLLRLMRKRSEMGFRVLLLGDHKQGQAIEAGDINDILHRAFPNGQVPTITRTVRQRTERERETALLFRQGRAAEALERKQRDGSLHIVPGDRDRAVSHAAALWQERREANRGDRQYALSISAPTNALAHAISVEIREHRKASGEITKRLGRIGAVDQNGRTYDLDVAIGDRLRLFDRVWGRDLDGKRTKIGNNGSVVTVRNLDRTHLHVVSVEGIHAKLALEDILCPATNRIRLAYGDCLTIDATQGLTSTEHIAAMPDGSKDVDGYRGYVANSRGRGNAPDDPRGLQATYLVTSEGQEMLEVASREGRPEAFQASREEVVANIARNLSRQPEKGSALAFLDRVDARERDMLHQRAEEATRGAVWAREEAMVDRMVSEVGKGLGHDPERASRLRQVGISQAIEKERVYAALANNAEAVARKLLGEPLRREGNNLRFRNHQSVAVHGPKRGKWWDHAEGKGGSIIEMIKHTQGLDYRQALDWARDFLGMPKPDHHKGLNEADLRHMQRVMAEREAQAERDRAAAAAMLKLRHETVARRAAFAYEYSMPVNPEHPYLVTKGVSAETAREAGLRQDRQGRIRIPMRDQDGKIWSLQHIDRDGKKLFLKGGRAKGLFHIIGDIQHEAAIGFAEGMATAATVREATQMPVVIAFNVSNKREVMHQWRKRHPGVLLIDAVDNDHAKAKNAGLEMARRLDREIGAIPAVPPFEKGDPGKDWNDYGKKRGKAAVKREMSRQVRGIILERRATQERRREPQVQER